MPGTTTSMARPAPTRCTAAWAATPWSAMGRRSTRSWAMPGTTPWSATPTGSPKASAAAPASTRRKATPRTPSPRVRTSRPEQRALEDLLHAGGHAADIERRAAVDLDREEPLPGVAVGQERVDVPPGVERAPGFCLVELAEALGDVGREEDGEVEAAVA